MNYNIFKFIWGVIEKNFRCKQIHNLLGVKSHQELLYLGFKEYKTQMKSWRGQINIFHRQMQDKILNENTGSGHRTWCSKNRYGCDYGKETREWFVPGRNVLESISKILREELALGRWSSVHGNKRCYNDLQR